MGWLEAQGREPSRLVTRGLAAVLPYAAWMVIVCLAAMWVWSGDGDGVWLCAGAGLLLVRWVWLAGMGSGLGSGVTGGLLVCLLLAMAVLGQGRLGLWAWRAWHRHSAGLHWEDASFSGLPGQGGNGDLASGSGCPSPSGRLSRLDSEPCGLQAVSKGGEAD